MYQELDRLAARQHGLVTFGQLLALGFTPGSIRWAERSGRLIRERVGVFRLAGTPATQEQAWMCAVLASPAGAVLSHLSGASLWQLSRFPAPDQIDVLVEGAVRPRLSGIVGHRTLSLPADHRFRRRLIPVTSPERTLVDACGLVSLSVLEHATDVALRDRVVSLPRLARCVESVPVSGRRALRPVRRVLAERIPGYAPGGSKAELDVIRVLKQSGLPLPVQQHRVTIEGATYFLDWAWPETRHALEYEGFAYHGMGVDVFHYDRLRTRRLQRAGWTIWPITSRTPAAELLAIAVVAAPSDASVA